MNTQLPFLVEGVLILAAMTFGILLDRKGKPYGKVKLVIHLFFALWFTVGFCFILYGLSKGAATRVVWVPVDVMGLTILIQLVTGIVMLTSKKAGMPFPKIHLFSAIVLLVSDICAFILTGLH
jgi:hypothetical protein